MTATGWMCGQSSQVEEYTDFLQLYLAVKSLSPLASLFQISRKHKTQHI